LSELSTSSDVGPQGVSEEGLDTEIDYNYIFKRILDPYLRVSSDRNPKT